MCNDNSVFMSRRYLRYNSQRVLQSELTDCSIILRGRNEQFVIKTEEKRTHSIFVTLSAISSFLTSTTSTSRTTWSSPSPMRGNTNAEVTTKQGEGGRLRSVQKNGSANLEGHFGPGYCGLNIANPCAYLISSVSFDLFFFYFPLQEVKDVLILGRGHSNKAKTRHPIAHNIKFNLHQIEANVANKLWGAKRIT